MRSHIRQIGSFLLYTLAFNVVSFVFYFVPAFGNHDFTGTHWMALGIIQILFTVVYFSKIPLSKVSYEKGLKIDLVIYFLILSVLSVVMAYLRADTSPWFTLIYTNTFFTLTLSDFLDYITVYIFVYIAENAVKTYCLYKNVLNKSISKTAFKVLSILIVVLYLLFVMVILPIAVWS